LEAAAGLVGNLVRLSLLPVQVRLGKDDQGAKDAEFARKTLWDGDLDFMIVGVVAVQAMPPPR
jgi:hypothetical protein